MTQTRTYYYWQAMADGSLLTGMYTSSDPAATVDLARQLGMPHAACDAYALIESRPGEAPVIIEIVAKKS